MNKISGVEIVLRYEHPAEGVRRTWTARDETYTGLARRLAIGIRHHRGSAFVTANCELQFPFVKGVENRKITFAWNAEHMVDPVDDQLID